MGGIAAVPGDLLGGRARTLADIEVRDTNGKVIGAATGDPAWVRETLARWSSQGLVASDTKVTFALTVIEGGLAPSGDDHEQP